ncbi:MAG: hypothetical protein A2Z34_09245 [Planctomycetes bacterium RBG_16_59_8]|nr:MAG: hypothetical protein A2Z34_09245 [Planctomycetes bacterium RBG_16_59_8]
MRYKGTIIRPPSEAESYLLQVTEGCTHNACAFCATYLDKPFRLRPMKEVLEDIATAGAIIPETLRVFLCDGNAMVLATEKLLAILEALRKAFPDLQRVGLYANARDILRKSESELQELSRRRLQIVYLGLESGSDRVLDRAQKGATAAEIVEAVQKAQRNGIKASVIAILGLGGREGSEEHAVETARAVSRMNPRFFSLLTLMLVPGTPLYEEERSGRFTLSDPMEMLREMRRMVELMETPGTIFRSNHASNYAPIAGRFNRDRQRILDELDCFLTGDSSLRPEIFRGL